MKAARAKKTVFSQPEQPTKNEDLVQNDDLEILKRRIEELESRNFFQAAQQAPQQFTARQTITKHSFNPNDYPDPTERLMDEPLLDRFGFKHNYVVKWKVERINYEEDGQKYAAPRFVLELWGKVYDEKSNELKKTPDGKEQLYMVRKMMFFEDHDSFVFIANQYGVDIPEMLTQAFMDEMRFMSARDWLLERFFPKPLDGPAYSKEEVIGNRLVPIIEVSSKDEQNLFNRV